MNTVTVKINGVEYNLRGKEDEKYLFDVAEYVDSKIREISSNNKKLSISSVAVLTAVNIADELFKCDLEINDITKKKNSLEERHLTLKERLRELKIEIEEASKARINEVESLKNMIFSMEEKLRESDELKSINDLLKENITKLTNESEKNRNKITSLTQEIEKLKAENLRLEEVISNCNNELNNSINIKEYEELNNRLKTVNENNDFLKEENDTLKVKLENYNNEISSIKSEKESLLQLEEELRKSIELKEIELEETKNKLLNEKEEETIRLENKIEVMDKELKSNIKKKEMFSDRNKEMSFKLQNYKYKVLDLEKKLLDAQFNLAVEKREKNPLLR